MDSLARQRFTAIVSKAGEAINLAEAALLIAQEEYPDLAIAAYLARLDQMADVRLGSVFGTWTILTAVLSH